MTQTIYQQAHHWLKKMLGTSADFRPGQWEAIEALVEQHQRVLVVQKTGWGKSLVYFLATRLLRDNGAGVTVLISPLLALMRNQIEAAERLGLRAITLNSTNRDDWADLEAGLLENRVDLLLISPERLANDHFQTEVWSTLRNHVGLVAIDEAHCISDWGHDFRPNYRRIMHVLDEVPPQTPILCTTATANNRVVRDVNEILGGNLHIQRGELTRQSLELFVCRQMSQAERLTGLVRLLKRMQGSGIIYCSTTDDCLLVADWLQKQGFNAKPYYSGVENDRGESRVQLEQQLLRNEVFALVASVALGMGFDKPDLHFVIHYQYPGSIVSYYQQIGRAGRAIEKAHIILMHGEEDIEIQRYFMDTAFPQAKDVERVIDTFALSDGDLSAYQLQKKVNIKRGVVEKILLHLELEQVIAKNGDGYWLTGSTQRPDYARWDQVSLQRQRELAQMQAYLEEPGCLMRFIARALDDPGHVDGCGRCQNCRQHPIKFVFTPEDLQPAVNYLQKDRKIIFEPRKMWLPGGVPGTEWRGKLKETNAQGLALSRYRDGGWGEYVRKGKYEEAYFGAELLQASAELLLAYWQGLSSAPTWVTAVPSLRHPDLVPGFAARLAEALHLPFYPVIRATKIRPAQKDMENPEQQVKNLVRVFAVSDSVHSQPVLLIDDMVDSNWTFTVLGELLREKGSGKVHPFALAKVSFRSD